MPGSLEDSAEIFRFLALEVSSDTYVNVMDQYYPAGAVEEKKYPELCHHPRSEELRQAQALAEA